MERDICRLHVQAHMQIPAEQHIAGVQLLVSKFNIQGLERLLSLEPKTLEASALIAGS